MEELHQGCCESNFNLAYYFTYFKLYFVLNRSGLAVKHFIDVGAGVIDCDYRGNVGVVLFNHGSQDFVVNRGDRIAQLILEKISMAQVEEVGELPITARGEGKEKRGTHNFFLSL